MFLKVTVPLLIPPVLLPVCEPIEIAVYVARCQAQYGIAIKNTIVHRCIKGIGIKRVAAQYANAGLGICIVVLGKQAIDQGYIRLVIKMETGSATFIPVHHRVFKTDIVLIRDNTGARNETSPALVAC
jgi:hypothetical protein